MAIDQRSGNEVNGVKNETAAVVKKKMMPNSYIDAEVDIVSAIDYLFEKCKRPLILVGSSYSASLVLKVAANNENVKAVAAFSPGEYFGGKIKVKQEASKLHIPVFITSSKSEAPQAKEIFDAIPGKEKTHFIPISEGQHGSRAMWSENEGFEEYREAFMKFLEGVE